MIYLFIYFSHGVHVYIFYMQLMLLHLVGGTDGQQNREGPGPSEQPAGSVDVFESKKKKEEITDCFTFLIISVNMGQRK